MGSLACVATGVTWAAIDEVVLKNGLTWGCSLDILLADSGVQLLQ